MLNQIPNTVVSVLILIGVVYALIIQARNKTILPPLSNRNVVLDISKGFAILNIIFMHTVWWSGLRYIPSEEVKQITLFVDVPLFFFLSGLAVPYHKSGVINFFKRVLQLYIPYLIYGLILITIFFLYRNKIFSLYDIFRILVFDFSPVIEFSSPLIGGLWYLRLFFIVILFTPLLGKLSTHRILSLVTVFGLVILTLVYTAINVQPKHFIFPAYFDPQYFAFYLLFYFFGIVANDYHMSGKQFVLVLVIISGVLALSLNKYPGSFNLQLNKFPPNFIYLICSSYSLVTVLFLNGYEKRFEIHKKNTVIRFFILCGQKVYPIFLYQHIGGAILYDFLEIISFLHWIPLMITSFLLNAFISVGCGLLLDSVNRFYILRTFDLFKKIKSIFVKGEKLGLRGMRIN